MTIREVQREWRRQRRWVNWVRFARYTINPRVANEWLARLPIPLIKQQ